MGTWTSLLYKDDTHRFPFLMKHLGRLVGKGALPSQRHSAKKINEINEKRDTFEKTNANHSFFKVPTTDNVILDTIEINAPTQNPNPKKRSYIIYFLGQTNHYESHLKELEHIAEKTPATVIAFNYRSVGRSTGSPPSHQNDLLNDGRAQINRLIKENGIPKEKIVLIGHSLGGGLATILAAEQKLSLINDRSYDTLIHAALQMFISPTVAYGVGCSLGFLMASIFIGISYASLPILGLSTLLGGLTFYGVHSLQPKCLQILLSPVFHLVMGLGGWEINAIESFQQIPTGKKVIYIIKSSKHTEGHPKYSDLARWCYDKVMGSASLGHAIRFLRKELFPKTSTEFSEEYLDYKPYKMVFNDENKKNKNLSKTELEKKKTKLHSADLEDLLVRPEPKKRLNLTTLGRLSPQTPLGRASPPLLTDQRQAHSRSPSPPPGRSPSPSPGTSIPPSPANSTNSNYSTETTASEKANSRSAEEHLADEAYRLTSGISRSLLLSRDRLCTLSEDTDEFRDRSATNATSTTAPRKSTSESLGF